MDKKFGISYTYNVYIKLKEWKVVNGHAVTFDTYNVIVMYIMKSFIH